ncbi:MAG TPA: hypothetical protein VKB88_09235 [Bryobacteraceae bacterium]|nr:hypothetical protein [Bryobacteraceae bacterium]
MASFDRIERVGETAGDEESTDGPSSLMAANIVWPVAGSATAAAWHHFLSDHVFSMIR